MSFGFGSNYKPKVDFTSVFEQKQITLEEILSINDILKQVRASSKIFTRQIVKNKVMIKRLIDYALRPEFLMNQGVDFPTQFTYSSIEILCGLQEQFYNLLFSIIQNPKITFNKQQEVGTLIQYLFKIIRSDIINQTAYGYLSNLIEHIIEYQKGRELLTFLINDINLYQKLFQKCCYLSIMNLIKHILIQHNDNLNQYKSILVDKLYDTFLHINDDKKAARLENYCLIVDELVIKSEEKLADTHKNMIMTLLGFIMSTKNVIKLRQVIESNKSKDEILTPALTIICRFMKFKRIEKKQIQIRGQLYDKTTKCELLEECQKIVDTLSKKFYRQSRSESKNTNQFLLEYLLLINHMLELNKKYFNMHATTQFVKANVEIMAKFPFNNLLHNCQKQIIIIGLNTQKATEICSSQSKLIRFIIETAKKSNKKSIGYQNQIFYIVNSIRVLKNKNSFIARVIDGYQQWQTVVEKYYQNTKENYQRMLGGENPFKQIELHFFETSDKNADSKQVFGQDTPYPANNNMTFKNAFQIMGFGDLQNKSPSRRRNQPQDEEQQQQSCFTRQDTPDFSLLLCNMKNQYEDNDLQQEEGSFRKNQNIGF